MTRKRLRSIIRIGGYAVIVIVVIGVAAVVAGVVFTLVKGEQDMLSFWNLTKDSFAVLGPIGTLLAVVVALNKEELNRVLYAPEFVVAPSTLAPQAVKNPNDSQMVQKYIQHIRISNIGAADAVGCQLDLVRIRFDKNRHKNYKDISPVEQQTLKCGNNDGTILKNNPYEFLLFEVDNPGAESSPGNQEILPASIKFNGLTLQPKHTSMGQYQIEYRLSSKEGVSHTFTVEVDWAGEWSDDQQEMVEKFVVSIKK